MPSEKKNEKNIFRHQNETKTNATDEYPKNFFSFLSRILRIHSLMQPCCHFARNNNKLVNSYFSNKTTSFQIYHIFSLFYYYLRHKRV